MPTEHASLVEIAQRWLSGTMRCQPVLSGIASTTEIPDAIGWSSSWKHFGSIVVECKTSVQDFHRDKHKKHMERIGAFRYFLTTDGLVSAESVAKHYPRHGLLYARKRRVSLITVAQDNANPDLWAEVRLLRFAIIHIKDNLLKHGCSVNLTELTKFFGKDGVEFPKQKPELTAQNRPADLFGEIANAD